MLPRLVQVRRIQDFDKDYPKSPRGCIIGPAGGYLRALPVRQSATRARKLSPKRTQEEPGII